MFVKYIEKVLGRTVFRDTNWFMQKTKPDEITWFDGIKKNSVADPDPDPAKMKEQIKNT